MRAVEAARRAHDIEVDLWTRSRLAHFLDNDPAGQWIRRTFLRIEQELLSPELLRELSRKSLEINPPPDDARAWVPCALDAMLAASVRRDVTFVVAGSGQGKSVACYRKLSAHVEAGGVGIVLSHDAIAAAATLDQAVDTALRQLHPTLAAVGEAALSFCSAEHPLLLVVEDINLSGQTRLLAEKIAGWGRSREEDKPNFGSEWRLLCPLWPEALASLGDQARKRIDPLLILAGSFTESEGRDAVLARARLGGRQMSSLSATSISRSLGHDPLLIALHDQDKAPDPHQVIGDFVEASLARVAAAAKDYPAAEYREALRALAGEMLAHRRLELSWRDVSGWPGVQGEPSRLIGRIAHHGELIRFTGISSDQHLLFRHDRVRDWLLADAAAELERRDALADHIVTDPYFAELMGAVLVRSQPKSSFLKRLAEVNPLALFHALRLLGEATPPQDQAMLQTIDRWLDDPVTHDRSNLHLRWEALAMLAETDSDMVPAIVRHFPDRTSKGELARLRNGDVTGGVELCTDMEPGVGWPWRDAQIEHAKLRHGSNLSSALDSFLRREDLGSPARIGGLRLAGHLGDPSLAYAIEACWSADNERVDHLADYLWAFGQCCGDNPVRFLGPVCDAWAALPDVSEREGMPSPRNDMAADHLRWAFHRWPPVAAIDYFVQRGTHEDLRGPITLMFHGMDHPKALAFVVEEFAAIQRRLEGTKSFLPFVTTAKDDWRRAQENGRPMSAASRDLLLRLWRDEANDKHLRTQAFSVWAATQIDGDLDVLRAAQSSKELADSILMQRLVRGDRQAIEGLIDKLRADEKGYWWQSGRHVSSPELTDALDEFLGKRGDRAKRIWGESLAADWITHEMIMRLPTNDAERLLLKHWGQLRFASYFVQAALYVATPRLLEVAQAAISECPQPAQLMEYLSYRFGIRTTGHPGLTREAQVLAVAPYLDLLSATDLWRLWTACNDHGWFATRRKHLDGRLQPPFVRRMWNPDRAASELDKMIAEKRVFWIDRWIDGFLKIGVSWSEILATLTGWLDARRSLEALEVVASAVAHRGTREDLRSLSIYEGMPENAAKQLIADTEFAVKRRTIR